MFCWINNTFHVHISIPEGLRGFFDVLLRIDVQILQLFFNTTNPFTPPPATALIKAGSRYAQFDSFFNRFNPHHHYQGLLVHWPQSFVYFSFIPHFERSLRLKVQPEK